MSKLSDTQRVILAGAAGSDDGAVLPLPESLRLNAAAADTVLQSLIKKGLIEERPVPAGIEAWREAEDGQRLALTVTDAGLAAIGIEPADGADLADGTPEAAPAGVSAPAADTFGVAPTAELPTRSTANAAAPAAAPGSGCRPGAPSRPN